jgi:2-dehydro-3-deoxyphosphogluconate aldolase / (4S)-4-hydroxy-2-oxoglutarate aldolase
MTRQEVRSRIVEIGIVPVVRAATAQMAVMAAHAVSAGGIPIVEITMTVPGAIEVIRALAQSMSGEMLIGAGTVLDAGTARRCFEAGAQFLVSPIFDPETIQLAKEQGKLTMAGALTPNEVVAAWRAGADFVKIFPCGSVGGPAYIKSLKSALPQIDMVPTGGVNLKTAVQFLEAGASALGVGSELISTSALKSGETGIITSLAREYMALLRNKRELAKTP